MTDSCDASFRYPPLLGDKPDGTFHPLAARRYLYLGTNFPALPGLYLMII